MKKARKKRKNKHERGLTVKARQLLRDPFFLYTAIQKVGDLGVVGEERNRGVLILNGISSAKGPPSSEKSNLVKTTLRLFPANCIVDRAGLSPKALAPGKVSLKHKILFLNELRSANEAQRLLRFYTARVSEYLRDAIHLLDKLHNVKTELSGGPKIEVIEERPRRGPTLINQGV